VVVAVVEVVFLTLAVHKLVLGVATMDKLVAVVAGEAVVVVERNQPQVQAVTVSVEQVLQAADVMAVLEPDQLLQVVDQELVLVG
jgi:hypothetical protein